MKKLMIASLCLIFTLVSFSGALAETKWDLHLNYPAGNFHSKGAQRFADQGKGSDQRRIDTSFCIPVRLSGSRGPNCCGPWPKDSWPWPKCRPAWWRGMPRSWR